MGDELVIWLFALGGTALLIGAFFEARAVLRLRCRGLRTEGTVIDNVRADGEGGSKLWVPVVGFTDHRGHEVEFDLGVHTRWKKRLGSTVPVIYLPERAPNARRDVWWNLWWPTSALIVLGSSLLFLAAGR